MSRRRKRRMDNNAADWTEVRNLPVGVLEIDPEYQRTLKLWWANHIAKNFKSILLGIIYVSYRDGHYYVFDGQHRTEAVRIKFNDKNTPMTCIVYHGLTKEEEARLFTELNTASKSMSAGELLKAQTVAGEEEVISFLKHTCDAGFIIDSERRVKCKYSIQAVNKLQKCFQTLGPNDFDRMLRLLMKTWDGESWSVTLKMLGGMCLFIKTFGDQIDDQIFVKQLRLVSDMQMVKKAARFSDESIAVAYASALVEFYNSNQRGSKRLKRSRLLDD